MLSHKMACRPAVQNPAWMRLINTLSVPVLRAFRHSPPIDFETMPDHVKRDLGFLDGRDPRYDDDRLR